MTSKACDFLFIAGIIAGISSVDAAPPKATTLFPAGAARGQTVEVTAAGTFDPWPVNAWVDGVGLTVTPADKNGQFTVHVAEDASPGPRWIRFHNSEGATSLLPFEVSGTPSLLEKEPNAELHQAQQIESLPLIVDGRLSERADVDAFAVKLDAGQTFVASLKGHRLGAPMDPVLQIATSDGFVLQQSDDEIGLDPQIAFKASTSGNYIVRCFAFPADPNSTIGFASGPNYIYRLTLTTDGFLDHVFPLAIHDGDDPATIVPSGWNIPRDLGQLTTEPASLSQAIHAWHPSLTQVMTVPKTPFPSVVEQEQNGSGSLPLLSIPSTISGCIAQAAERDLLRFSAKKDQKLLVRVAARELNSSLDPVIQILDRDEKILAEQDDAKSDTRDIELQFTAPEDADYQIALHDLHNRGGLRFFYRLDIMEPTADFRLSLPSDQLTVTPGTPTKLDVTVNREHGFDAPIELTLDGLPPGVEAPPIIVEPEPMKEDGKQHGASSKTQTATITITAPDNSEPFSGPVSAAGTANLGGTSLTRNAMATTPLHDVLVDQIWLTVLRKQ